jgi:site-specific DNA recombinase
MKIADLYIRARCDDPARQKLMEQQQEKELEEYCVANNIKIRAKVIDNCSAGNFDRPGWSEYYDRLVSSTVWPDLILFTTWDRFTRNLEKFIIVKSNLDRMQITAKAIKTNIFLEAANRTWQSMEL